MKGVELFVVVLVIATAFGAVGYMLSPGFTGLAVEEATLLPGPAIAVEQPASEQTLNRQPSAPATLVETSEQPAAPPASLGISSGKSISVACTDCTDCTTCAATPGNTCTLSANIDSTDTCITVPASGVTIDCAGFNITYASTTDNSYGIDTSGISDTVITGCNITQTDATFQASPGINAASTSGVQVLNSRVTTPGAGISGSTASSLTVLNTNFILSAGGASGFSTRGIDVDGTNIIIRNNSFTASASGVGIAISGGTLVNISNNTFAITGPTPGNALELNINHSNVSGNRMIATSSHSNFNGQNVTITNNNFRSITWVTGTNFTWRNNRASSSSVHSFDPLTGNATSANDTFNGRITLSSTNLTLHNSTFNATSIGAVRVAGINITLENASVRAQGGIHLMGVNGSGHIISNVTLLGTATPLLNLTDVSNSTFNSLNLSTTSTWMSFIGTLTSNRFFNVNLSTSNGSIYFPEFNVSQTGILNRTNVTITLNQTYVNTTGLPFLNQSAQIQLRGLSFTDPQLLIDTDDDGAYAACGAPDCTEINYAGGTLLFNVSHFTSHAASETTASFNPACPYIANESTTMDENLTCDGTAVLINADNLVFDCAGYFINHSNLDSETYGIVSTAHTNVTILNCNIVLGSPDPSQPYNIFLNYTNSSLIVNTTGNAISDSQSDGLRIHHGHNNTVTNTTFNSTVGSGITLFDSSNNTLENITAISDSFYGLWFEAYSSDNVVRNYTAVTASSEAIRLELQSNDNLFENVSGTATNDQGIEIVTLENLTIRNSNFRGVFGDAFRLVFTNDTLIDNVTAITASGFGLDLDFARNATIINAYFESGDNWVVILRESASRNNLTNVSIATNIGVPLRFGLVTPPPENNTFDNITLTINTSSSASWIQATTAITNNTLRNVLFNASHGTLLIGNASDVPTDIDLNATHLNVSYNNSLVNTSNGNASWLNASGQVTLYNLTFTDAQALIDANDDGAYALCSPPECDEISYVGGTFVFNVSHFTSHAASENVSSGTCPGSITTSVSLTGDINGTSLGGGNCIETTTPGITIDCQGYTMFGDNVSTAIYVNTADNVTIENCVLVDWDTGISYELSNNGLAQNNTINNTANGLRITEGNTTLVSHNRLNQTGVGLSAQGNTFAITENHTFYNNTVDGPGGTCLSLGGYPNPASGIFQNNTAYNCQALAVNAAATAEVENLTGHNTTGVSITGGATGTFSNIFLYRGGSFTSSDSNTNASNIYIANATGGLSLSVSGAFPSTGAETVQFTNVTVLSEQPQWLMTQDFVSVGNTIAEFTFGSNNGSVTWTGTRNLPAFSTVGDPIDGSLGFNITYNHTQLNSTYLPFLNTSARVSLFGLPFANPTPLVDFENDGTFTNCNAIQCQNTSFSAGNFTFDVLSFTGYAASESPSNCTQVINSSTTLSGGISCPASAVLIAQDNTTLDCAGNTIEFDTAGGGFDSGIIAGGRDNITVRNCIITDPTANGINAFGINLTGTILSAIHNNTITSNATSSASGIFVHESSENNTIDNNTVLMNGSGSDLNGLHFFTEPQLPMTLRVLDSGRTNIQPHLAIDSDNNVHVVAACRTTEIFTGNICYEKLDAKGNVLFNDSAFLTNDEEPIRTPFLARTSNDTLFISFTGNDVGGGDPNQVETVIAKFLKNSTILQDRVNNTPDEIARSINMRIVADSAGKLQAAWSDEGTSGGGSDQFRIRYARFNDTTTGLFPSFTNLTPIIEINESETNDSQTDRLGFDLAVDKFDNVHLVFRNEDRDRILYMLINGTNASGQILIAPTTITNTTLAFANFPQIVIDENLVASIVFLDESLGIESYITQLEPYNESLDGSNSSMATIVKRDMVPLSLNDGFRSTAPAIDIDRLGNLHIVWKEESVGASGGIVYTLLDQDLNVLVPQTTLTNSTANVFFGSPPVKPFVKVDHNQRAHVVWHDFTGTDDIYYANTPSGSSRNSVENNTIISSGNALHINNAANNTFTKLNLRTISTNTFAVVVNSSTNTSIQHALLNNSFGWLNTTNSTTNFTNTTFATDNGTIRFNGSLLLNETTITQQQLNITANFSFVNSTNLSTLNTTAQITLNGIGFVDPQTLVDFEDDGTFAICSAPQCVQESYAGGVLVFNVSSFTSYASAESIANASTGVINLTFDKLDSPDPTPRGSTLTYQIQINNTGNATAENLTVVEGYPAGVSFVTASPTPVGNNTFNLGNLSGGNSTTINITVTVGGTLANGTVLNNSYNVSFQNNSGSTTLGNDSELTTVLGAPVLVSIKSDTPDPVIRGQQLNYSILINNTGDDTAFNVSLTENYPGGVSFATAQPTPAGNGTFSIGTLAPNESFVVNVTVTVGSNVANGTILNNSVNASWRNVSGQQAGVSDSELTTVLGIASISVTKTDSPDPITNGSVLSYQITVTNTGDEIAYNVTAVDGYPANVSLATTSPAPSAGNDTFSLGNLTPGQSTTINITVTVDGNMTSGILNNTVNVTFTNTSGSSDTQTAFQATTVTTPGVPAAPSGGGGGGGSNFFRNANVTREQPVQTASQVTWPTVAPSETPAAPAAQSQPPRIPEPAPEPILAVPANVPTAGQATLPGDTLSPHSSQKPALLAGLLLVILALATITVLRRASAPALASGEIRRTDAEQPKPMKNMPTPPHRSSDDLEQLRTDVATINKLLRKFDKKIKR